MPRIDLEALELTNRTGYPPPLSHAVAGRHYRRLGPPSGLTDLAASHVTLDPGTWSSQRHVHDEDDELLVMLAGEAVLVEDEGRTRLVAGDVVAFPKNGSAHHLINDSDAPCTFVCVSGPEDKGDCRYPDVDLHLDFASGRFTRKDGTAC